MVLRLICEFGEAGYLLCSSIESWCSYQKCLNVLVARAFSISRPETSLCERRIYETHWKFIVSSLCVYSCSSHGKDAKGISHVQIFRYGRFINLTYGASSISLLSLLGTLEYQNLFSREELI